MGKFKWVFVVVVVSTGPAFAFSAPGHEAIAVAALKLLDGTPAGDKVKSILGGQPPEEAAIWLDQVREIFQFPTASQNAEASQFRRSMPGNASWHFCNFIVGSTNYSLTSKYASKDDVVHGLELAIHVLEGVPSPMTQQQALRTVIHLVGDIHQPLHCITGYYDLKKPGQPVLLTDVADPAKAVEDRGGNQLYYTGSEEFHALWDKGLPALVGKDVPSIAAAASVAPTAGDYHHWPEAWATESMKVANEAYQGIVFNSSAYVPNPRKPGSQMLKIDISLPGGTKGYEANEKAVIETQLSRASAHLAQLLGSIKYK